MAFIFEVNWARNAVNETQREGTVLVAGTGIRQLRTRTVRLPSETNSPRLPPSSRLRGAGYHNDYRVGHWAGEWGSSTREA